MTQPKIEGVGHGAPRMLYASDGSNWYALKVRDSGILEVCSKDGDKIFGFESIVEERIGSDALVAGTNIFDGTPVPSGKVWKITHVSMIYTGTPPTYLFAGVPGLAEELPILRQTPIVSGVCYSWSGEIYMQVADKVRFVMEGATLNDDAYLWYAGVQMNAP